MDGNKDILLNLLKQHQELGITEQIDYDKFYLYSIITHSTAIEGSTVTEVEAQLLFDEGITSSKRTMVEQMMNLDLKVAYEYGREWIKEHKPITVDWLVLLASKVMARTGSEYNAVGGSFSAAKGEIRLLNVTAGLGGKSYMSYLKVPAKLQAFCEELNRRRAAIDPNDVYAVYELSYWAHFELVTIHPWADGNGRTCRLLMNLLQMEFGVLPTKVLKQDKAQYIQALIDTREQEDIDIFINCMHQLHCEHLRHDIDQFLQASGEKMVDKLSHNNLVPVVEQNDVIIYHSKDGKINVALMTRDGNVWLNQQQIATLFATSVPNISMHIANVLKERELDVNSVIKNYLTTASDGKSYDVTYYSLQMIIAVGFRVRGMRGTQFRQWANNHLSEYLIKGFTMDDERLKNPDGRPDYFDEMLEELEKEIKSKL